MRFPNIIGGRNSSLEAKDDKNIKESAKTKTISKPIL